MTHKLFIIGCIGLCALSSAHATVWTQDGETHSITQKLKQAEDLWEKNFGKYVANDIGYRFFLKTIRSLQGHAEFPFFSQELEEITFCATFSRLRCATCYAMALQDDGDPKAFSEALSLSHNTEIYQVFVAVDSYHKGRTPTKNSLLLKNAAESILSLPIDPQERSFLLRYPWVYEKAQECQESPFQQRFMWLQDWGQSRDTLSQFLEDEDATQTNGILLRLRDLCRRHPYVLHHLELSDIARYAHIFLPALYDQPTCHLQHMMRESLPFDPNKAQFITFIDRVNQAYRNALNAPFEKGQDCTQYIKITCSLLIDSTWLFLQLLHAHMTEERWSVCITNLKNLFCIRNAFQNNGDWLPSVFCFQQQEVSPMPMTKADHYKEHHAPFIFARHTTIVNDICRILDKHCTPAQRQRYPKYQEAIFTKSTPKIGDCLNNRNLHLIELLSMRCAILWKLSTPPVSTCRVFLYTTCSLTEKRSLCAHTLKNCKADDPHKSLFLDRDLLNDTQAVDLLFLRWRLSPTRLDL